MGRLPSELEWFTRLTVRVDDSQDGVIDVEVSEPFQLLIAGLTAAPVTARLIAAITVSVCALTALAM